MNIGCYNFNYGWSFRLADTFPLTEALRSTRDSEGLDFYEREYRENAWERVSVPHTYNDKDLFVNCIEDAGSNQKRTFACYRKWFDAVEDLENRKVFLEFEGIRQTCYLYVNGILAGYIESGVAPFGFDITAYVKADALNLIAIATDSTSSRNMDFFSAETPNMDGAEPGSFYTSLTVPEQIPEANRGVGYFWNCNDFNPCVGGLSRNIRIHIKPRVYLTLPLYSNLRTKGCYVWGTNYVVSRGSVQIHTEAQVRNESGIDKKVHLKVTLFGRDGKSIGHWGSGEVTVAMSTDIREFPEKSIIPRDAYYKSGEGYLPVDEEAVEPTDISSPQVQLITAQAVFERLNLWSPWAPHLYTVRIELYEGELLLDTQEIVTGFRKVAYDGEKGLLINECPIWLTGYAQRATNEWPAIGCAPDWLKDQDAMWIRESNANHIRFMHVAGCPADVRSYDRYGIICTQPAGDKERENFGRQWDQRVEAMRDVIIYFRNNPSILFWEAGNNSISREHMREMRLLKEALDPNGGRFMGCRTINTEDVICEAEYVGTMLNRHAARFQSLQMPVTETEYLREEAPRRIWDDFTPPDYDYDNLWLGKGGRKQVGADCYDLTSEDFALCAARGYEEFFHNRMGGGSGKNLYSATAALCWTDSAQHGRQAYSENARMSGRVDPVRIKKQNYQVFKVLQSSECAVHIVGHWNYPRESEQTYLYPEKEFDGRVWQKTGKSGRRNPKDKTVYVIGSYPVAKVELYINESLVGVCDTPEHSFVFTFPHIDITQAGFVEAVAYDYEGKRAATDRIETVQEPKALRLSIHTGERGLLADGGDIAYVDVEVVDEKGRICPLCSDKITFRLRGAGCFLGGYNSGRFNSYGRLDSVIHQDYVYAECGVNRVFIKSGIEAGEICLTASMEGVQDVTVTFETVKAETSALVIDSPHRLAYPGEKAFANFPVSVEAIAAADQAKYKAADGVWCKVLVNGQEPNTNGVLSVVDHESVYSPILFILEAMHNQRPEAFTYFYKDGTLDLRSGENHVIARNGYTHLWVNGEENLMNGQPYLNEDGIFILEINAFISYIQGVKACYDDKIQVFRISW